MGEVRLFHPVTEDKAREFVEASYVAPDGADEAQQETEKKQRVEALLQSARENAAWRGSRTPDEQILAQSEPFAVYSDEEETDNASA